MQYLVDEDVKLLFSEKFLDTSFDFMLFDDLAICLTLKTSASMIRHFKYVHHLNENFYPLAVNYKVLSSNP